MSSLDISNTLLRVQQMLQHVATRPDEWRSLLQAARNLIIAVDNSRWMQGNGDLERKLYLIEGLQKLAFTEPDSGGVSYLADWCSNQALALLQQEPSSAQLLRCIGENWLARAQPYLARIHMMDGSPSSSGSARVAAQNGSASDEERAAAAATAEADQRLHKSDYVEARAILASAADYLRHAVDASGNGDAALCDLLATAAEAYMSLGNVTSSRSNRIYFQYAVYYLRRAAAVPGHSLSAHLQEWLDDIGRFVP